MNLDCIIVQNKEDLVRHRDEIFRLFKECFLKPIDKSLWYWAYIENPLGDPIVSLCHNDKGELVGHYAVIPYDLENQSGELKAALSMTTMVDSKYRKYGLFVKQAEDVYSVAQQKGYHVVFGFPNKNSAPGFRKRLGWRIDEEDHIVSFSGNEFKRLTEYDEYISDETAYSISQGLLKWRLEKPGAEYLSIDASLILKRYGSELDIMLALPGYDKYLEDGGVYNVLVDTSIGCGLGKKNDSYLFGYKVLDQQEGLGKRFRVRKSFILSDVF